MIEKNTQREIDAIRIARQYAYNLYALSLKKTFPKTAVNE